ncbi:hypothetical protein [Actinopolyspora saharensis]|uniref:hypothetical protein n=1 Tax=Actinopolyspora saharensis TaxID=995062 RepID=UPI003F681A14
MVFSIGASRYIGAATLGIVAFVGSGAVACADDRSSGVNSGVSARAVVRAGDSQEQRQLVSSDTLNQVKPYVSVDSNGVTMTVPEEVEKNLPREEMEQLREYQSQINQLIADGAAEVRPDGTIVPSDSAEGGNSELLRAPTGHGYVKAHWYGLEVAFDSWVRNKINATGGVGALVGAIATGPWAVVIEAASGVIVAEANACAHEDGYTYMYFIGVTAPVTGGIPTPVCNPFG